MSSNPDAYSNCCLGNELFVRFLAFLVSSMPRRIRQCIPNIYVECLMLKRRVGDPLPILRRPFNLRVAVASMEDALRLSGNMHLRREVVRRRLEEQQICFLSVGSIDGNTRILGYGWVRFDVWHCPIDQRIVLERLRPGEAFFFGAQVFPTFRGRGVYGRMMREILKILKERRYSKLYTDALTNNVPAVRAMRRLGFMPMHIAAFLKVPGFRAICLFRRRAASFNGLLTLGVDR